jgi:eukaryotic-like serine/threonine-protein kinase
VPFLCPHCQHAINARNQKPGRYQPKCPGCGQLFQLIVAPDGGATAELVADRSDGAVPGDATSEFTAAKAETVETEPPRTAVAKSDRGAHLETGDDAGTSDVPASLGGYRVMQELGRGGMGAVYLAHQASLDREVALKVMKPKWGRDAAFVARFTREAYAAAQLTHHNMVHICDFGKQRDLNYFSMEYVEGQSLGDLVRKQGKLDVEHAVGYALQAARGLKFAHGRGMVHRDVKPDNLMLNSQGIVKVADLGLVKTPGALPETEARGAMSKEKGQRAHTAVAGMGTPEYMSPEQARDAAHVDQRADIYSLGCTLYVLLTGRPPFQGSTVLEIFSQHATAPLVPPDTLVKRVPKELSTIIQRMVAKKPEDRFADMGEVVKVLEEWLGAKGEGRAPELTDAQVRRLERCVGDFNGVGLAKLRIVARLAIVGGCLAFALLFLLTGWLKFSFAAACLAIETGVASFVIGGILNPSPLFRRVRELVLGLNWKVYLRLALGALLFVGILVLFKLVWIWLIATVVAGLLGAGLHFGLDRLVHSRRLPSLQSAEELLKQLRLRGIDEEALRNLVCKYGGNEWEEFYENLFGYEEKLKARDWWVRGEKGQSRRKHAAWREPIIAALDARLQARKDEVERRKLQAFEEERLKAEGLSAADTHNQAGQAAERLVQCAAEMRQETIADMAPVVRTDLRKPRKIATLMLQDIDQAEEAPAIKGRGPGELFERALNFVAGPTVRFLLGAVLLAGCLYWMYCNDLIAQAREVASLDAALKLVQGENTQPLNEKISFLPGTLTKWFDGYGSGLAGLLLLISALLPHWSAAIIMPIAAAIALMGHRLGIPELGPLTSMAIATVLGLIAVMVGRRS